MADLSEISILIKTFLRDEYLFEAIRGIDTTMPEVQMVIVDDGDPTSNKTSLYEKLRATGHKVIEMPFDSGFGAKSNEGMKHVDRPYVLIGSDDFDFSPAYVRAGIEKMVTVLDGVPQISIAGGRVNNYPYEGWLVDKGDIIEERYIQFDSPRFINGVEYHHCNLTVNYTLNHTEIFGPDKIHWDDDVKIGGGEHGALFVDIKRANHAVVYVKGVTISEQSGRPVDLRYSNFRGRARLPGRPCFAKRGIHEYVMFGGAKELA